MHVLLRHLYVRVCECVCNKKNIYASIYMFVCKYESESAYARVCISLLMCGGGQASQGVLNRPEAHLKSS